MIISAVLFTFGIVLIVWWFWKNERKLKLIRQVPHCPGSIPILGHTYRFVGSNERLLNQLALFTQYAMENGGVARFSTHHLLKPHFVITDPKDATTILNTCLNKAYIYDIIKPLLGQGLVTAEVTTWRKHRRLLNPAFNAQVLNSFIPIFERHAKKFIKTLEAFEGLGQFDPSLCLMNCTFETILETAIGVTSNMDDQEKIVFFKKHQRLAQIFTDPITNVFNYFKYVTNLTSFKGEQDFLIDEMYIFSREIVEKRKLELKNNSSEYTDKKFKPFLQAMLEMSASTGVFDENEINEEVMTILLAGYETTALVLVYLFLALGSYPKVQERVYQEIKEVIGEKERDISKDDFNQMVYLEAVINETLRLYPIGYIIARDLDQDVRISKYTLPAGSCCFVSIWGLHTGKQWGPDALEFNPDRWLDPSRLPNLSSFGGFSIGKRMCIGKNYAMLEMKTVMAYVLRKYIIKADISKLQLKLDMLLKPLSNCEISIESRDA